MTAWIWALAALGAGVLGWVGPRIIASLPPSPDAAVDAPSYRTIAAVPRLRVWLALGAVALVTVVGIAVPAHLLPAWVVVCGVGIWLAYVDWRTKLLPTRIVWPLYAVSLAVVVVEAWLAGNWAIALRAVIASTIAFGVFWVIWWIGGLWKAGGFGFGDVRFSAPLGLVLGSVSGWAAPLGLYLGILLGGVAGIVLLAAGRKQAFAFGPWMLLGAVLGPLFA